jgi:hypothetical protein|nr:type IV secretion system protein VirB7 [uncultured bacterium]
MKQAFVVLLVVALAGCATNKAVLPSLEGKPRVKINATAPVVAQAAPVAATPAAGTFDFSFNGDILDALKAVKAAQPQINLLPPLGKPSPLNVNVNLRGATLDDVLRAIGEQGGDAVDVVLNKSKHQGGNQVLVRFNNPKE